MLSYFTLLLHRAPQQSRPSAALLSSLGQTSFNFVWGRLSPLHESLLSNTRWIFPLTLAPQTLITTATSTIASSPLHATHSHGPTPSSVDLQVATYSHYELFASILGSFAAALEEEEATYIASEKMKSIVSLP
ncbi:hypothetical protein RJT34_23669 [Clitoria ternatea]|uniref:Uncharacterized protein n=1 Tax=Clitoria ternatea TaxID=43366 RepID=A0AAN9IIM2_CLITE